MQDVEPGVSSAGGCESVPDVHDIVLSADIENVAGESSTGIKEVFFSVSQNLVAKFVRRAV